MEIKFYSKSQPSPFLLLCLLQHFNVLVVRKKGNQSYTHRTHVKLGEANSSFSFLLGVVNEVPREEWNALAKVFGEPLRIECCLRVLKSVCIRRAYVYQLGWLLSAVGSYLWQRWNYLKRKFQRAYAHCKQQLSRRISLSLLCTRVVVAMPQLWTLAFGSTHGSVLAQRTLVGCNVREFGYQKSRWRKLKLYLRPIWKKVVVCVFSSLLGLCFCGEGKGGLPRCGR